MTIQPGNLLLRLFILAFLMTAGLAVAVENRLQNPAEWSQSDVERILRDSPWSLPVSAVMDDPSDRSDPSPTPLPGAAEAGLPGNTGGAANGARWDGGVGRNRTGRLPTIPVQVQWESAAILQAALARAQKPLSEDLASSRSKDFILAVTGLIPSHRYRTQTLTGIKKSSSGDTADPSDPEEVLESFMANSRLSWKGASLQPENVRLDADTGAVHIFFPKTSLSPHTKEVFFVTSFGSMHVQARFRLKEMTVDGKPDL